MPPAGTIRLLALLCCVVAADGARARSPEPILNRLHGPMVAAHRGGEFGLPNSLVQFAESMEAGDADILEMDLRLTLDGQVVVFHDDSLERRSDCTGTVESKRYIDLMQCKLDNGERIPLFEDVLELIGGERLVSAEPKGDAVVIPAARLVLAEKAENWVYFQTLGSEYRYRLVREVAPNLAVMATINSPLSRQWIFAANDPFLKVVELDRDYASPALVDALHRHGKLATMNSWRYQYSEERFVASCDRVFEQGIDIAVSNNARSCQRQKSAWNARAVDAGQPLDRQHVRRWARQHPTEMRFTLLAPFLLLVYLVFLGRWLDGWRRQRAERLSALARAA